jgi:hypothetical protein
MNIWNHNGFDCLYHKMKNKEYKGPSTLLVLVGRFVWLLLVLVNRRPHYFSCSPGFSVWGSVYLLVVCIGCSRLIKARHRPHDSGGLSRTPVIYQQQAEPHKPVACAAHIACLVTLSYRLHYSRA